MGKKTFTNVYLYISQLYSLSTQVVLYVILELKSYTFPKVLNYAILSEYIY